MTKPKSKRNHRGEELIQHIIAQTLQREVQDARLSQVTITGVDLSPDFKQATVYFSLLKPTETLIKDAQTAFKKASAFFRVCLSKQTELRHTPQLTFKYDTSIADATRISDLLRDVGE